VSRSAALDITALVDPSTKKRPCISKAVPGFTGWGSANTAYDLPESKIIRLRTRNGEKTNGKTK
jgi:hypothetical protein